MSAATSEIDLEKLQDHKPDDVEEDTAPNYDVPSVDGGFHAWMFLGAACIVQGMIWGFPFSYGTFQKFYQELPAFEKSTGLTNVGTVSGGLMYVFAPFVIIFLNLYPKYCMTLPTVGFILIILSLIGASFAKTVGQLIWTQGVLYGIGGALVSNYTSLWLIPQWFVKKRGLAWACTWGSTGISTVILPLILDVCLHQYDYPTVHRASAILLFVICFPCLFYLRPRIISSAAIPSTSLSLSFLISPLFVFLQSGNILQGLGYFIPFIFIPARAALFGTKSTIASLLLSISNLASIIGQPTVGRFSDHGYLDVFTLWMICAGVSAIATLTAWGLGDNYAVMVVYSICYGFFAGSFSAGWMRCAERVKGNTEADVGMIGAVFMAGRGIGNFVSGPLSEAVVKAEGWQGAKGTYGTKYGGLVVVAGVTSLVTAMFGGVAKWWWMREMRRAEGARN